MPTNPSPKKVQLDKDKTVIFVIVSIAAVVTIATLMISKGLWSQASYLGKVAGKKEVALKQLKDNKQAVSTLKEAYTKFKDQNPNLLGANSQGTGPRDGDNATLVLDALPSKYDFPAVASSLEKILAGYKINGITATDDSIAQAAAIPDAPIEIPFSIDIDTSYTSFRDLINAFNKSIRPFQLSKIEISGNNSLMKTQIQAKTFYQPEVGLQIVESDVQ